MGTEKNVAASAGDGRDDLEKITGIGRYWANALNRIGIYRFEDLAQCLPPDLSQLLDEAGFKASPEKTEKWIAEAKERAWKTHAEFSVFFEYKPDERGEREWQTRVYGEGEEKYGAQKPFQGIEPAPWVDWILEQAKLPAAAQPVPTQFKATAPPMPGAVYDAQVEILDVQMSEIEPSPEGQQKGLMAEVRFKISGPGADKLTADRIPFRLEMHAVDLESAASYLVVAEGGELEPQVLEYTSQQAFPIPELGRYELHTTVLLLLPGERIAHYQGPTFRVVP